MGKNCLWNCCFQLLVLTFDNFFLLVALYLVACNREAVTTPKKINCAPLFRPMAWWNPLDLERQGRVDASICHKTCLRLHSLPYISSQRTMQNGCMGHGHLLSEIVAVV